MHKDTQDNIRALNNYYNRCNEGKLVRYDANIDRIVVEDLDMNIRFTAGSETEFNNFAVYKLWDC